MATARLPIFEGFYNFAFWIESKADFGSGFLHHCPVSKTTAAVALEMPNAGGVENSSKKIVAGQGMSKQNLDCQGKLVLFAGDSVGHTADLKYLERSIRCQLESVRAYSSVMDQDARWPRKNFTDVVTQYLRGPKPFNIVVMSAPTVDISNLNIERLTQRQCEVKAIESSKNMISLAEKILANSKSLEKVILMEHHARFDCIIKKKLAILSNQTLIKFWACSPFKGKIHVGHHNLDSSYDDIKHNEMYRGENRYDGVHLYGKKGVYKYTESVHRILCLALSLEKNEDKLRLKGGANKKTQNVKIKTFISKFEFLNEALTALRSSNLFQSFKDHKKCPVKSSCNFCLLRSTILKANLEGGRQAVTPVEMECLNLKENSVGEMMEAIFANATCSMEDFSAAVLQEWSCSCCKSYVNGEGYLINLEQGSGSKNIGRLLEMKYESVMEEHRSKELKSAAFHEAHFNMSLNKAQKTCVFYHKNGMDVNLLDLIPFGDKLWKCVGLVTASSHSYFRIGLDWYKFKNGEAVLKLQYTDLDVGHVICAVYDVDAIEDDWKDENLCYKGKDLMYLADRKPERKKDRHVLTEKRKEQTAGDRHVLTEKRKEHNAGERHVLTEKRKEQLAGDRHVLTEERKQDRHVLTEKRKVHNAGERHVLTEKRKEQLAGDRHVLTEERKQDRHVLTEKRKLNNKERKERYNRLKKEKEMLTDTAMECICSSCVEWKSLKSCVTLDKLPVEKVYKYCVETDLTRSPDSKFYICSTCKSSIDKNKEPVRSQKEILGLLSYPDELIEELEEVCTPWSEDEKKDPDRKFTKLNRLEEHLLKLVIPFIRIGHLPRSRYFQLKGDLIMVSADVEDSLNMILPVKQNLIPVAFKRKLEYPGYFIREHVDRNKVRHYFEWFKKHNHLFENFKLEDDLIEEFERESMKIVQAMDDEKNQLLTDHDEISKIKELVDLDSDEELDEESTVKLDKEQIADHSSFITNKYCEDTKTETVANHLSDMILRLESSREVFDDEFFTTDPEELIYEEDEIYVPEEDCDDEDVDPSEEYSDEDMACLLELKNIKKDSRQSVSALKFGIQDLCKCGIERHVAKILDLQYNLEAIEVRPQKLLQSKGDLLKEFADIIAISRNRFKEIPKNCHHRQNNLAHDIEKVVECNKENPESTASYICNQVKKIKENAEVLEVAPTDKGKFVNWKSEIFLEEKLFPNLFPYGIGGYLSSNLLKQNTMGFSNYIKNRLLSADPKFRNDATYCFFLLLVKELTDMKRSEVTYIRKATRVPDLTAQKINEITKQNLFRYDNAYSTFKTIRGTAMYYQDVKKRLMACLRQKGAPTLFTTFSCAEFEWNSLAKSIYETVEKKKISLEEIAKKPTAWRNKLLSDNVLQSTLHFSKRTDKIMSLLSNKGIFSHNGQDFVADFFFYRVEFQARGAPHIHCLLWLKSDEDKSPPSLWNEDPLGENSIEEQIASFADSVMCGSSSDMNCDNHSIFNEQCGDCLEGKHLVEKFQSHSHKATCRKKGKMLRILSNEGHGRLDNMITGDELTVPVCRLRHPKFPIDKTEFIRSFPEDTDENELVKAKYDYKKIKKYLLRMTHGENFKESESFQKFQKLSFSQFLFEVGMFDATDVIGKNFVKARQRYLNALRCEVKSSGLLVLRRSTADIFTNNFNKKLIRIHQANQDIQFITDEYAVAEYICNYLTKNEAGMSAMLKNINDEAVKEGEEVMKTIKKLATALDKGREMSIQEAIYRSLGLKMTKFRDVIRFVNTSHPDRREGLLKPNLDELEEGEKIFYNSLHDYYQMRPFGNADELWDDMCLADFASQFNIAYKTSSKQAIGLLDGKSYIIKRGRPCVLRYFLKYENEEEYFRALCILFLPFRDEKKIHQMDMKTLYFANEKQIEENRSKYEKHKTMIDLIQNAEKVKVTEIDDDLEEDSEYIVEETTDESDIKDFEKKMKQEAQKSLSNFNAGSAPMGEDDYLEMISKLNSQQREIFNDFNEQILSSRDESFYLYIGGEAGTGKSFLLKAMINACKKRGKRSGAELDKPVCLTLAPTGVSAYLVNGTTIESGLSMQPSNERTYIRNQASKNSSLRFRYEDLQVIFVDEISMVGSDMLAKMNYRLQDIMGNTKFMGGVSMVCTGDFGQLPPVGQKMIWEKSYMDNRCDISPKHWDEHFKIFYLDMKMRSQDEEFSNICDHVRRGNADEHVIEYFNKHVGRCPGENDNSMYADGKLCIIVTINNAREKINNEKLENLLPDKPKFYANAIDKSTNNPRAPEVHDKIPLTRTGQLPKRIIFKEDAPVMITKNSSNTKYKTNGIVNGARGKIDSIQPSDTDPEDAEVVWVRFNDDKIGQLLRFESKHLLKKHKPRDPLAVPITRQKNQFKGKGNTEYLRDQFPLTLCYAVTAHKSQGQTLDEVIIDFSGDSKISNGSFYTAISRVKFGKNLYLKDFKKTYIKANEEVEKKMESMKIFNKYNFKKTYNYERIFVENDKEVKIGYININDIQAGRSLDFLNNDRNLLALDFLTISDSRLSAETSNEYLSQCLSNWKIRGRFDSKDDMRHMGMLILKSKESTIGKVLTNLEERRYKKNGILQIQIVHISIPSFQLECAAVYARETPTQEETRMLKKHLCQVDLIIGDLNLEPSREKDFRKLQELSENKSMILKEITTSRFDQLDHVLLNCSKFEHYSCTSFMNFTTDHHAIVVRIPQSGNKLNQKHLQKLSCNPDKRTFRPKSTPSEWEPKTVTKDIFIKKEAGVSSKEQIKSRNNLSNINLSCLYSPNWLNDEVINEYLKLVNKLNERIFIYETQFHEAFSSDGFSRVENYYRRKQPLSFSAILIPVHNINHWFLIKFSENELVSYDPYNYPGASSREKQEKLKQNFDFQMNILNNLREDYFKPLHHKYEKSCPEISLKVLLPPEIPAQNNGYDCGVFLLAFAKCILTKQKFDFCGEDMLEFRNIIRKEMESQNVSFNIGNESRKRVSSSRPKLQIKRRKEDVNQVVQRRIINPDLETCWLNSCLQLVLTAFDYIGNVSSSGSPLWKTLVEMKAQNISTALDPSQIKNLIIQTEMEGLRKGMFDRPMFDLSTLTVPRGSKTIARIGQQDCRDFFNCLSQYRESWEDVFQLFRISTVTSTTCPLCKNVSMQDVRGNDTTFIVLDCPDKSISMKSYVEQKLNGTELREWRDEKGCGKVTQGIVKTRLTNVKEPKFIIILIARLMSVGTQLHIADTKVINSHEEVTIQDMNGESSNFSPIAIIHHSGVVTGNDTRGHYRADVKNQFSNTWYRTSDNDPSQKLSSQEVTKTGYIFLYKQSETADPVEEGVQGSSK